MKKSAFRSSLDRIAALPVRRREKIEASAVTVLKDLNLGQHSQSLAPTPARARDDRPIALSSKSRAQEDSSRRPTRRES